MPGTSLRESEQELQISRTSLQCSIMNICASMLQSLIDTICKIATLVIVENQNHTQCVTIHRKFWPGRIIGPLFFENEVGQGGVRYLDMKINYISFYGDILS